MKTTSTTLMIALAALAGLTSCADDEPVSYNSHAAEAEAGNAISFRPAMGSRATEITNANLESFNVTSLLGSTPYFNEVEYTKGTDGFFNSASPYYWPGDSAHLDFYAYAPSPDEGGYDVVFTDTEKIIESFTVADTIPDQIDLITAYGRGNRATNESSGVELTFDHRLSQVEIQAKSSSTAYTYKVVGARIGGPQITGTFDFTTNEWTLSEFHESGIFNTSFNEITLSSTPVSLMGTLGNAMMLPQKLTPWSPDGDATNVSGGTYLSVLVQITATETGTVVYPFPTDSGSSTTTTAKYAWAAIPISTTWEQGKKYVYTLDFTNGAGYVDPEEPNPGVAILGDPIKFTVNVQPWQEADQATPMPLK